MSETASLVQMNLERCAQLAKQLLPETTSLSNKDSNHSIYLLNEQYIIKPPKSPSAFSKHQDSFYLPKSDQSLPSVSFWIPLCATNNRNGGIQVFPFVREKEIEIPFNEKDFLALHSRNVTCAIKGINLDLQPGSVLCMSGWLPHASSMNSSSTFREVYMPQFATKVVCEGLNIPL